MPDRHAALKDALHLRFLARCERDPFTGCWIWTGAWQKESGLGVMRVQGRLYTAHRVALWVYQGGFELSNTAGIRVYHAKCASPACCAHEHLARATVADVNTALGRLGRFTPRIRPCIGPSGNASGITPGSRSKAS